MNSIKELCKHIPKNQADKYKIPFIKIQPIPNENNSRRRRTPSRVPVPRMHLRTRSTASNYVQLKKSNETYLTNSDESKTISQSIEKICSVSEPLESNDCIVKLEASTASDESSLSIEASPDIDIRTPFLGIRTRSRTISKSSDIGVNDKFDKPEVMFIDGVKFVSHNLRDECQDSDICELVNQYIDYDSGTEDIAQLPKKTDDVRKIKGLANRRKYKDDYEDTFSHGESYHFGPKRRRLLKSYVYGTSDCENSLELMHDPFTLMTGVQLHEIEDAFLSLTSNQRQFRKADFNSDLVFVSEASAISAVTAIVNSVNHYNKPELKTFTKSTFPVLSLDDALRAVEALAGAPQGGRPKLKKASSNNLANVCVNRVTKTGRTSKVPARFRGNEFKVALAGLESLVNDRDVCKKSNSRNIFAILDKHSTTLVKPKENMLTKVAKSVKQSVDKLPKLGKNFVKIALHENHQKGNITVHELKLNDKNSYNVLQAQKQKIFVDRMDHQPSPNLRKRLNGAKETVSVEPGDLQHMPVVENNFNKTSETAPMSPVNHQRTIILDKYSFGGVTYEHNNRGGVTSISRFVEEVVTHDIRALKERQRRIEVVHKSHSLRDALGFKIPARGLQNILNNGIKTITDLEEEHSRLVSCKKQLEARHFMLSVQAKKLSASMKNEPADILRIKDNSKISNSQKIQIVKVFRPKQLIRKQTDLSDNITTSPNTLHVLINADDLPSSSLHSVEPTFESASIEPSESSSTIETSFIDSLPSIDILEPSNPPAQLQPELEETDEYNDPAFNNMMKKTKNLSNKLAKQLKELKKQKEALKLLTNHADNNNNGSENDEAVNSTSPERTSSPVQCHINNDTSSQCCEPADGEFLTGFAPKIIGVSSITEEEFLRG